MKKSGTDIAPRLTTLTSDRDAVRADAGQNAEGNCQGTANACGDPGREKTVPQSEADLLGFGRPLASSAKVSLCEGREPDPVQGSPDREPSELRIASRLPCRGLSRIAVATSPGRISVPARQAPRPQPASTPQTSAVGQLGTAPRPRARPSQGPDSVICSVGSEDVSLPLARSSIDRVVNIVMRAPRIVNHQFSSPIHWLALRWIKFARAPTSSLFEIGAFPSCLIPMASICRPESMNRGRPSAPEVAQNGFFLHTLSGNSHRRRPLKPDIDASLRRCLKDLRRSTAPYRQRPDGEHDWPL